MVKNTVRYFMIAFATIVLAITACSVPAEAGTEMDLTMAESFPSGSTKASMKTGQTYNLQVNMALSSYAEPILKLTVPANYTTTYTDISAYLNGGAVTTETLSDGSTEYTFPITAGTASLGFTINLTPTVQLLDATAYITSLELYDGTALQSTKSSEITTINPTVRSGAIYTSLNSTSDATGVQYTGKKTYAPFMMQLVTSDKPHYRYNYIKQYMPIPDGVKFAVKGSGDTYTTCVDGQEVAFTGGKFIYHENYDSKGQVLELVVNSGSYITNPSAQYDSYGTNRNGCNMYVEFAADAVCQTYSATYGPKIVAGVNNADVTIQDYMLSSSTYAGRYFKALLKAYNVGDFFYSYWGADSHYAYSITRLPGANGDTYANGIINMPNSCTIFGRGYNNTGEEIDNVVIDYNLPQELYLQNISFAQAFTEAGVTSAAVKYKTKNGGGTEQTTTVTALNAEIKLTDTTDAITYMKVTYNKVATNTQNFVFWMASGRNKDEVTQMVNATTQVISGTGSDTIGTIPSMTSVNSNWYLAQKTGCNAEVELVYDNDSFESSITTNKGDSFGINLCFDSRYTGIFNNPTFSVLVPSEYQFQRYDSIESMIGVPYEYTSKEITVGAGIATTSVPAGKYTLHTIHYTDGINYETSNQYYDYNYGMIFWFKIGPLVNNSISQSALKTPVVFTANTGFPMSYFSTDEDNTDVYDIDGDGNTTETTPDVLYSCSRDMTINSLRAVTAEGALTSSSSAGENTTQNYECDSTGSYKYYLFNGLDTGNDMTNTVYEFTLPKNNDANSSKWGANLTGVPVLTGTLLSGATVSYKHGENAYTTTPPATLAEFATVTKIKIETTGTLASTENAVVEIPFVADFASTTAINDQAYIKSTVSFDQAGSPITPIQQTGTLVAKGKTITGKIYNDYDCDDTCSEEELETMKGHTISLYSGSEVNEDNLIDSVTTDADSYGAFSFQVIQAGQYTLQIDNFDETGVIANNGVFGADGKYTFTFGGGSTDVYSNLICNIYTGRDVSVTAANIVSHGETKTIQTVAYPTLGAAETITYVSNDTDIVTVSNTGVMTYVADGDTTIDVKVPQSPAYLAKVPAAPAIITKTINVSCKNPTCNVTADPYFAELTEEMDGGPITQTIAEYSSSANGARVIALYMPNRSGTCEKEHASGINPACTIISDTGANAQAQMISEGGLYGIIVKGTSSATQTNTVVVRVTETWNHEAANAPVPIDLTIKFLSIADYHDVTINSDNEDGMNGTEPLYEGYKLDISAGTKENYEFAGWVSSNGGTFADATSADTVFTVPNAATTLTASWTYNGPAPTPTVAPTATPAASTKPTATPAASTKPTATPVASTKPTATPVASTKPTATPVASTKPTATPAASTKPTATPTASAKPTATPVASTKPTATPTVSAVPTTAPTEAPTTAPTVKPATVPTTAPVLQEPVVFSKSNQENVAITLNGSAGRIYLDGVELQASEYTIENGKVVISSAKLTDLSNGEHIIKIDYVDGAVQSVSISVVDYDKATTVTKVPTFKMVKQMGINQKFWLRFSGVSDNAVIECSSSNSKVAVISKNGRIKAKKAGKAMVKINVIQNGSYYQVVVKVVVKKSIKKNYNLKSSAVINVKSELPVFNVYKVVNAGKKTKLNFINMTSDAKVTYTSSKKGVATVSKKGVIKGKKNGYTVVTAKIEQSGKTYFFKIITKVGKGTKKLNKKYLQ